MPRRLPEGVEHPVVRGAQSVRSLIPMGMATLLPDTAQRVRELEGRVFSCFTQWGYREIIPPTFEYLDVLSSGLPPEVLEKCYKFADWSTGRILALRPDVTAQIARIVAMGMAGKGLPLRLSYRTTVYRYEPEHAGRDREIFQIGIELIGQDTASMDAEILSLLIETLSLIGLPEYKISLGHVGFFQALLAKSKLSVQGRKQAELAAAHKDIPRLEAILQRERVSKKEAKVILETPGRYGGEEVLRWGKKVAGRNRQLLHPIERLEQVYRLLETTDRAGCLLLDLGEFRGFDYYDGLVFDVFSPGVGCELGGGGRYNHLIGRFGRDIPSTGFALDVDRLFGALEGIDGGRSSNSAPILLVNAKRQFGAGFQLAQQVRSSGFSLIHETVESTNAGTLQGMYDRARQQGIRVVIDLSGSRSSSPPGVAIRLLSGRSISQKRNVAMSDVVSFLHEECHARL